MSEFIDARLAGQLGLITLQRPKALNSLSLEMVRTLTTTLRVWRDDPEVAAVLIQGSNERAFCAGGDIRFFHQAGSSTPRQHSALLEDFFSEEYALNHLIHFYPKPYIAFMDGVVMGGGMGIAQAGPGCRCRIVTERTKMAMPEVNIGLFPDVGGSYFLSRAPGQIGIWMGLSGETINAADALAAGLADFYVPGEQLPVLQAILEQDGVGQAGASIPARVAAFCANFAPDRASSSLARNRALIDYHFAHDELGAIMASLAQDSSAFAQKTLQAMQQRSPLMMAVTLAQLRRGAKLGLADCLRMERTMVRRNFEHGEVLEGVRALVIDKDNAPRWSPPTPAEVTSGMVQDFFVPAWPASAHPLRDLCDLA
jgi:enoyl-CoA hydratase/carnithine racemase